MNKREKRSSSFSEYSTVNTFYVCFAKSGETGTWLLLKEVYIINLYSRFTVTGYLFYIQSLSKLLETIAALSEWVLIGSVILGCVIFLYFPMIDSLLRFSCFGGHRTAQWDLFVYILKHFSISNILSCNIYVLVTICPVTFWNQ